MTITNALVANIGALEKAGLKRELLFEKAQADKLRFFKWQKGAGGVSDAVLSRIVPIIEDYAERLGVDLPYIISKQTTDVYAFFLNRLVEDGVLLQDAATQVLAGFNAATPGIHAIGSGAQ